MLALCGVAFVGLLVLGLFIHPGAVRSSTPSRIYGWYSGDLADKPAGLYSPLTGAISPNPLPEGAKFGDVPFASVGGSKARESAVPNWAGGDGGAKQQESTMSASEGRNMRWNGTHWWEPTVLLVSLDGVRADYLERGLTPNLLQLSKKGLRAEYLQPQFPSLTFVNHWSIATGLYPASHGIVANDFFDPRTGKEFVYTDPAKSWAPEWWGGEPIWSTAVKNDLRSAVLMWPGPPKMADGTKPTYFYPFINHYHVSRKVERVAAWLDLPFSKRPHLMQVYAPEVDQEGHRTGPESDPLQATLREADGFAKDIFATLEAPNLTDIVDVIFVSDHGMAPTHNERLVFLDDILGEDFDRIEHNEGELRIHSLGAPYPDLACLFLIGWPSAGLRFAAGVDEEQVLSRLRNASEASNGGFHVYTPETWPERFHMKNHPRIPGIYVVPALGWAITDRKSFHVDMAGDYVPKGNHGYDPQDPSMRAFFCAHGPFANSLKAADLRRRDMNGGDVAVDQTTVIPGFGNHEIYDLVMDLLGVEEENRAPTNGTVGFWAQYLA